MLHVNRRALRRVQAAAVLWVVYGVLIHAFPVVVANSIVASVALYSSFGGRDEAVVSRSCELWAMGYAFSTEAHLSKANVVGGPSG
ncbi:MAG TPA: hypothetical protein VGR09_04570 [Gemmatimonadales bacterium]|nr:hypothetical protein [Gemmatimonadales bacterium]